MKEASWRKPQEFSKSENYSLYIDKLEPKKIQIEKQKAVENFFKKNNLKGMHYMVYGMYKAYCLIDPGEYDLVIRYRFDIRLGYIQNLTKQILNNNLDNKVLMAPHNWCSALGAWFDGILISSTSNYEKIITELYKNMDDMINEIEKCEVILPELIISNQIRECNLSIIAIKSKAELIRANNYAEQKFHFFISPFLHRFISHLRYIFFRMPTRPFKKNSFSYKMWKQNLWGS